MKRHKNRKNKKLLVQGNELPSTTPLDRSAVFTREDLENHTTYHEYNRFTVMGLDLQPDITCDGQISAADSGALALDWNREWLVPATTNRWFPVKIFKDVALPGVYKVTVTGSTNVTVRYGSTRVRGGQSEEVDFPLTQSQETLEVQAAAPGAATLTVSFTGTGTATNYTCSTYVNITAWDVEFSESAFTDYNFSPSLGEYGAFGVRIVNAPADATEDFSFKLEIVREIENNGEQHIDWVPVGNGTAAESRPLDFTSNRFDWDGISSVTRASSNGRDSFQGVAASAVRVFPAVTAGQPVPPPFVTAVAKIIRNSDSVTVCEARKRVCIPQVVKIVYDADAVEHLMKGIVPSNTNLPVLMYPMTVTQWLEQKNRIKVIAQQHYDTTQVNVRFCDENVYISSPYSTLRMIIDTNRVDTPLGSASTDFLNTNPTDTGNLFSRGFIDGTIAFFVRYPTSGTPATHAEMGNTFAITVVHETGHMLGLVAPGQVLDGDDWHNRNPVPLYVMNGNPEIDPMSSNLGRDGSWSWRGRNVNYLRFILPKE